MECHRVQELLSEYVDGGPAGEERAAVETHLERCRACAEALEALRDTLARLSALPRQKAPPELMERVLGAIAAEGESRSAPGKGPFRRRFGIPLEAAAAVFLLLLVYGVQRQMEPRAPVPAPAEALRPDAAPPPTPDAATAAKHDAARAENSRGGRRTPVSRDGASGAAAPAAQGLRPPLPGAAEAPAAGAARPATAEPPPPPPSAAGYATPPPGAADRGPMTAAGETPVPMVTREPEAMRKPLVPAVAASRVIPVAEAPRGAPLEPRPAPLLREAVPPLSQASPPVAYPAPPSRRFKAPPYGREITLAVGAEGRFGLEERIAEAAQRRGGILHGEAAGAGMMPPGSVRVVLPMAASAAFIEDLKGMGTIPPEGMPAEVDLPAGPSPGLVAYSVRIVVR